MLVNVLWLAVFPNEVVIPSNSSSRLRVPWGLRQYTKHKIIIINDPTPNAAAAKIKGDTGRVPKYSIVTELEEAVDEDSSGLSTHT